MARKKTPKKLDSSSELPFDFNTYHFQIENDIPLTKKQKEILKIAQKSDTKMIILDGLPGSGKTLISVLIALEKLRDKKVNGITSFRSTVQAKDGETGFLSGDLPEKMRFFSRPFYSKMQELLKDSDIEIISKKLFDFLPTSFVRSISLKKECLILSEAQNARFDTIFDVACRAGEDSFVIIEGDSIMQNDIGHQSGFKKFCSLYGDSESKNHGIYHFEFDESDIVRSDLVQYLVMKRMRYFKE